MTKITISKRERLTFVPEGQDDVDEAERFTLYAMPLTLAEEERVLDSIQSQQADGATATGNSSLINGACRTSVVGWDNTGIDWDEAYSAEVPDEILAGIPFGVRAELFSFLLNHAGMRGEVVVGESE